MVQNNRDFNKWLSHGTLLFAVLLGFLLLHFSNVAAYDVEKTDLGYNGAYRIIIQDDAKLFSVQEEQKLIEAMLPITEFGSVGVYTIETHGMTDAVAMANHKFDEIFGNHSDATLFVIDMKLRKIVLVSEGRIKRTINNAYSETIMDNVYKYATKGDYYTCCEQTFIQEYQRLHGQRIAQPMKYICNAFLAVFLAILINFAIVRWYTKKMTPEPSMIMENAYRDIDLQRERFSDEKKTLVYVYSGGDDSFGGGSSSGGGSSGSSHSSGSHSF